METKVINILIIVIASLSFSSLLGCVWMLMGHINKYTNQLREIVREYKTYQAAVAGDMGVVRTMKSVYAGVEKKNKPTAPEPEEEESSETVVTQFG